MHTEALDFDINIGHSVIPFNLEIVAFFWGLFATRNRHETSQVEVESGLQIGAIAVLLHVLSIDVPGLSE